MCVTLNNNHHFDLVMNTQIIEKLTWRTQLWLLKFYGTKSWEFFEKIPANIRRSVEMSFLKVKTNKIGYNYSASDF